MGETHEYCENIRNYIEVGEPYLPQNDRYLCRLTGKDCVAKVQKPSGKDSKRVELMIDRSTLARCPTLDATDKRLVGLVHQLILQRETNQIRERLSKIENDEDD